MRSSIVVLLLAAILLLLFRIERDLKLNQAQIDQMAADLQAVIAAANAEEGGEGTTPPALDLSQVAAAVTTLKALFGVTTTTPVPNPVLNSGPNPVVNSAPAAATDLTF